jgi:hypothetical protein
MNPHLKFWNETYSVGRPLEVDSWGKRLLNRQVAALMNRFPHAATKVFTLSKGELARRLFVEREGGSFLVLRAMYEYENPRKRGDLINRLLMQSPAIKAARNRRIIAQRMLLLALKSLPADSPSLVLAIGGGDGSLEAEAIAEAANPNVYLVIVDKDERAIGENEIILKRHGLEGRGFVFLGTASSQNGLERVVEVANRRFEVGFAGLAVTVCQGITEYLDIGSEGNREIAELLAAIYRCTRKDGCLLLGQTDFHDRVAYLERGLSWHMRLRSREELAEQVIEAGWRISVCEMEPMQLITMCSAIKSDIPRLHIDGPSTAKSPHEKSGIFRFRRRARAGDRQR